MTVLLNTTAVAVVLSHHTSHIADTGHLTGGGVREDNLVGNLIDAVLGRLHMDGHLLVFVADAAAHGGDALSLEARKKHLLTDAVCLQALTVYIERYLLFLLAKHLDVGNRRDVPQAVGEPIAVVFQLAVAALSALDGDEQGRGVAEVIVYHNGQHA